MEHRNLQRRISQHSTPKENQNRLPQHPRIFVALDLDRQTRSVFSQLIHSFKKYPQSKFIRWVPSENLHMTLRFIGPYPLSKLCILTDNIRKAVRDIPVFKIQFDELQPFPSKHKPRVFAVGIKDSVIMQDLFNKIENACVDAELAPQQRQQRAHITLGRFHNLAYIPSLKLNLFPLDFEMRVDTITIFQSEHAIEANKHAGSRYIALEKIQLA